MTVKKHFLEVEMKSIKAKEGGKVTLQGYANKNIIDSYNERVDPNGINLTRFKQNPVLLFNHDMDYPIGKVKKAEPREEGVWVEAEISNSDSERIKYVRDLIEEGSLCTFSIGFMVDDGEEHEDGYYLIKEWTLHELSVVSIPANEESTFAAERKDMRGLALTMKQAGVRVNNSEAVEKAAKIAGVSLRRLTGVIQGVEKPTPQILNAINKAFEVEVKAEDGDEKPKPSADDMKDMQQCVEDKIPKLIAEGKPQDEAVAIAISMCSEENGKSLTEDEKSWLSEQVHTKQDDYQTEVPNSGMPEPTLFADMAKSINSMTGELVNLMRELVKETRETREIFSRLLENAKKPDTMDNSGSVGSNEEDDGQGDDEGERLFFARIEERLKRFNV